MTEFLQLHDRHVINKVTNLFLKTLTKNLSDMFVKF